MSARAEFRASTGPFLGWLTIAGLGVFCWVSITQDSGRTSVLTCLGALVVAVLMHAYLIRPKIRVSHDEHLELLNPWTITRIPLARVGLVLVRTATFVYVGEKKYVAVAVGRTTRDMVVPESMRGSRSMLMPKGPSEPKARDREAETMEQRITELARGADPAGLELPVTRVASRPHIAVAVAAVLAFVAAWVGLS